MGPGAGRVDLSHATVSRRARRARGLRFVDRGSWDVGRGTWVVVGRGGGGGSRFAVRGFRECCSWVGVDCDAELTVWEGRGVANVVVCRMSIVVPASKSVWEEGMNVRRQVPDGLWCWRLDAVDADVAVLQDGAGLSRLGPARTHGTRGQAAGGGSTQVKKPL